MKKNHNYIQPDWNAPNNICAFTSLRDDDLPNPSIESAKFSTQLQLPCEPIWLKQIHSTHVIEANPANLWATADASFATEPEQICAVMTADCLPILLCDQNGSSVAAIHGGWRGLAAGVIEATIAAMPVGANQLMAWLGPAIGPEKFEVGRDVYDAFIAHDRYAIGAFLPISKDKWLADLYFLAKLRLQHQGIKQIYGGGFCTYQQSDLFFSYRRDKNSLGRMATLIWIR